ncbi:hypothetical protein RclHR1_11070003 [Rhizophagus clarus]|nr:hypothetical protein RclHR1_11070003 [Rhizophagus clarus]
MGYTGYVVNNAEKQPYPNVPVQIKKIDVGQGEDSWILSNENKLYNWNPFKRTFLFKRDHVLDFAVGLDGTIVYIDKHNNVHIRDSNKAWHIIYTSEYYEILSISLCDYKTIFLVDGYDDLIKGVYNSERDEYNWDLPVQGSFKQASCASHDYSLWVIYSEYVYLYINESKKILRAEFRFEYIKALSEQHAIGIDLEKRLWEYSNGTWTWIRSNIKSASINYGDEIYYVDNNNEIYKPKN